MAPTRNTRHPAKGVERVRHELLTALHFGKLTPGDRAPSVRRLADRTGMNRKTVHRAYTRLAREGLLDLRPGSGTFIAERIGGALGSISANELLLAANRCRASAASLGLSPEKFCSFLNHYLGNDCRHLSLATVECNEEQLGFIAYDLHAGLGAAVRQVLLSDLSSDPGAGVLGCSALVTTDCHYREVAALAEPLRIPVYRVAMDLGFPRRLIDQAAKGPVVLVVRDPNFAPVFRRLLDQMSVPEELAGRFHVVPPGRTAQVLRELQGKATLCVSPLIDRGPAGLSGQFHRLKMNWRLDPGSMDRLKASLALDMASGRLPGPTGPQPTGD